jgi:hypothetical protein
MAAEDTAARTRRQPADRRPGSGLPAANLIAEDRDAPPDRVFIARISYPQALVAMRPVRLGGFIKARKEVMP